MHLHSIYSFSLKHSMNFVELILLLGWFILDEGGWAGFIGLFFALLSEMYISAIKHNYIV